MKFLTKILPGIGFIFAMLVSCSEDPAITYDSLPHASGSRALVTEDENTSITNPTLIYDWENVETIVLNSKDSNTVTAPWSNNGPSGSLSEEFMHDIHKADGWDMLFHTFKEKGNDALQNYMCFYNKFTGFLKVFYYCEMGAVQGSYSVWSLQQDASKPTLLKMFDSPNYFSKADNEQPINPSRELLFTNNALTENKALEPGWNGFQYQISRYADESMDCVLKIGAYNKTITTYEFSGKSEGYTTGNITSVTSTDKNVAEGVATRDGGAAKLLLSNVDKLKDIKFLKGDLKKLLDTITKNEYFDAIAQGLKYLFGRSTVTTYYTKSDVYLQSKGTLTLQGTGTSTSPSGIPAISFNLKNVLGHRSTGSRNDNDSALVYSHKDYDQLGVWTISTQPKVYYFRVSTLFPTLVTTPHNYNNYENAITNNSTISDSTSCVQGISANSVSSLWDNTVEVYGNIFVPYFRYDTPKIIFNPGVKKYLKSYNVSVKFHNCYKANGEAYGSIYDDIYRYDWVDPVYEDKEKSISSIKLYGDFHYRTPFPPDMLNENDTKNWYFDWGTILAGRLIAFVSVDMKFDYNGKVFDVYETRVYPVIYGYDPSEPPTYYHNPPHDFVINFGCPLRDDLQKYYGGDPSRVP